MHCLICEPIVELIETGIIRGNKSFDQFYKCPKCNQEYICPSEHENLFQENLELIE